MKIFFFFVIAVGLGSGSGLIYKTALQTKCRSLALFTVERGTVVFLFSFLSLKLSDFQPQINAFWVGLAGGIAIMLARLSLLRAFTLGSTSLSWTIHNLSVAIPISASIFLFGEDPTRWQVAGLVTVPLSIMVIREKTKNLYTDKKNLTFKEAIRTSWLSLILICFLFEGCLGICFKLIKEWGLQNSGNFFILIYNLAAFLICLIVILQSKQFPTKKDFFYGTASGICIGVSSYFWVRIIVSMPGIIFFPIATIGGILVMTLCSYLIWNEKINRRQKWGLILALISILLVSIPR